MKYDLMPVPDALAEVNYNLRTGQKSVLADLMTSGINCPSEIELLEERKARSTAPTSDALSPHVKRVHYQATV